MTIAQALKRKNRIAEKLKKLQAEIAKYNSIKKDYMREVDIDFIWNERNNLMEELIELKTAVSIANVPIQKSIFKVSELKSYISFLQMLDTKSGKFDNPMIRYSSPGENISSCVEYEAYMDKGATDELCDALRDELDSEQEKIDSFNATTHIRIAGEVG